MASEVSDVRLQEIVDQADISPGWRTAFMLLALRKTQAKEREACAKVAEGERVSGETGSADDEAYNAACGHIAAAIRARGGE